MPVAGKWKASEVMLMFLFYLIIRNVQDPGDGGEGRFQRKNDELMNGLVEFEKRVAITFGLLDTWYEFRGKGHY